MVEVTAVQAFQSEGAAGTHDVRGADVLRRINTKPNPNSLGPMTDVQRPRTWSTGTPFRTWGPWLALASGVVIIVLGGVLFSPGVSP